jgi:hypothetical protein
MGWQVKVANLALVLIAPLGLMASQASADEVHRSNWVPNVGQLNIPDEQPLGDLWTFRCPKGGTVTAFVETKDDTDTAQSDIDPVLRVVDGQGNVLASGDDEFNCFYPPICGYQCPRVDNIACGQDGKHSIIVRDFGASVATGTPCQEGGGYNLTVQVFDSSGSQLPERRVELGGGPRRDVPRYALEFGKAPTGPALDDEDVPADQEFPSTGQDVSSFRLGPQK